MARVSNLRGPGPGRPKGTSNKLTTAFKDAVLNVYRDLGGDTAFLAWGKKNGTEFYRICSRLIPHEVSGPGGAAIQLALKKVVHEHHDTPAKPEGTD